MTTTAYLRVSTGTQDLADQKLAILRKEEEIRLLLQKQVSKASIAKIVGVTRPTIYRFIETKRYA